MSIFTAIGRVLRFAGDEFVDVVTDAITRRAGDDLVDITPEVAGTEDLGALENLGQAEPQMTINITPEQQAGIDAMRAREAAAAQDRADAVDIDDDIVDADFEDIDIANAEEASIRASTIADMEARDAQSINIALRDDPIFQDPEVRLGVEQLRVGGGTNSEIREYLSAVKRDYEEARRPVYNIEDARNTEQLRELYEREGLPIPKTDAEEKAAKLIIEAARGDDIGAVARRNIDLDYLKAHAPEEVFAKHGPTIQERLQSEGVTYEGLGALSNTGVSPVFFSAAQRAVENLKVPSGSYEKLKKLALKQKGAKAKEFEWSGADEAFEGRTDVTPAELAEYLEQNTDLIEAETRIAPGIMRGDGGGDEVRQYINDNLAAEIEFYRDDFIQDFHSQTNMDKISDINSQSLDEYAEQIDGVNSGRELEEKYPDGFIAPEPFYGEIKVFTDDDAASNWEWSQNESSYDNIAREALEDRLENWQQFEPDEYNRAVYGNADPPADPDELEYAGYFPEGGKDMRETTYQYRDPTGVLDNDYFRGDHFGDTDREEGLVAHARTAEFPVEGGGTAYHLGEAQSDVQQEMRKSGKTPRTRGQEVDRIRREELDQQVRYQTTSSENELNKTLFGDEIGLGSTFRRSNPEYEARLGNYKKIIASFKNDRLGTQFQPEDIADDHSFFTETKGDIETAQIRLDAFAEYIKENSDRIPDPSYLAWANRHTETFTPKRNELLEKFDQIKPVNLNTTKTGAPFVESTDAWLDMILRRQLAEAVESGSQYMTLPNPQMVKDYTYGDFEGHRQFYGNIAPKNLLNIAKTYDPDAALISEKIITKKQPEIVTALPITETLKAGLMSKGLPKYVVPFGGVGYGALGAMTEDEEMATGGGL